MGVKKVDSTAFGIVVSAGGKLIDGDSSATILGEDSAATFVYDGTNWQIQSTAVMAATVAGGSSSSGAAGSSLLEPAVLPSFTSGYWYNRRNSTWQPNANLSGLSPAATTIYYTAQYLPRAVTISAVGYSTGSSRPPQAQRYVWACIPIAMPCLVRSSPTLGC